MENPEKFSINPTSRLGGLWEKYGATPRNPSPQGSRNVERLQSWCANVINNGWRVTLGGANGERIDCSDPSLSNESDDNESEARRRYRQQEQYRKK